MCGLLFTVIVNDFSKFSNSNVKLRKNNPDLLFELGLIIFGGIIIRLIEGSWVTCNSIRDCGCTTPTVTL